MRTHRVLQGQFRDHAARAWASADSIPSVMKWYVAPPSIGRGSQPMQNPADFPKGDRRADALPSMSSEPARSLKGQMAQSVAIFAVRRRQDTEPVQSWKELVGDGTL